jgi:hypothetical protein
VNVFDEGISAADDAISEAFGETAHLTARRGSDYRAATTDPDRAEKDVWGVFTDAPKSTVLAVERGRALVTAVSTSAEFSMDAVAIADLGWLPVKNDLLTVRGMAFTVNAAPTDDRGGISLQLTREDV